MLITSGRRGLRIAIIGTTAIAATAMVIAATAFLGPKTAKADHAPVHGTLLARAGFVDATDLKVSGLLGGRHRVVQVKGAADTLVQRFDIQPGGFTGWHTHAGPAVVLVGAGTFTLYEGSDPTCSGSPFEAGEAFVDPGQGNVHAGRNEGSTPVVLYVTFFDVPTGSGPTTPAANPGHCSGF